MQEFMQWFLTGIRHILDIHAADHLLFVSLLTLSVPCCRWSQLILLLSAFTFGHFCSTLLAWMQTLPFSSRSTEILIALTITAGALHALWSLKFKTGSIQIHPLLYLFVFVFGIIHGLGFASTLQALSPDNSGILRAMIGFNLGVETGQLAVAFFTLGLFWLTGIIFGARIHIVKTSFYSFVLLCSLYLVFERI